MRALRKRTSARDGGRLGPPSGRRGRRQGHGSGATVRTGSVAYSGGLGSARIAHQTTAQRYAIGIFRMSIMKISSHIQGSV
jgi:hypothetical protein